MTGSSATRSTTSSATHQTNSLMRKKFWDTVLNPPETPHHLTTSPVSRCSNQTSNESLHLVLPQHCPTSATSSTTFQPPHKPSYGERNASTNREIETWQKTRKARPFKCSICQSCYAQKGDMVRHMRCVHEGLRPFQCSVCGNAFGRRSILNKHMKRHWKNAEETQCPVNVEKRVS